MAARENQGLHIALILFVMITVLLAVVCYFTYTGSIENAELAESRKKERDDSNKLAEAHQIRSDYYSMMIGFGEQTDEEAVSQLARLRQLNAQIDGVDLASELEGHIATYENDISDPSFGGVREYRLVPGQLLKTLTQRNVENANLVESEQQRISERDAAVALAQTERQAAEDKAQEILNEQQQDLASFRQETDAIKTIQLEVERNLNNARNEQQAIEQEASDEIAALNDQIQNLRRINGILQSQLAEYESEEFDIADGRITDISSRTGVVWIDLGFGDNLPSNATFAVYPQDSTQFHADHIKGMIEVKRIMGQHIAEARITMNDYRDPILPGDAINTTTWSPGRRQSFGIAGSIDIDNDGQSDASRLRNIITRNGGDVVAFIDEEGNVQGTLDAKVRYLITGDDFRPGSLTEDLLSKMVKSTTELNNLAREEGVEKMYFRDLLEEMGYRGEASTDTLGAGGGDSFVPRRPPGRGADGSAFD